MSSFCIRWPTLMLFHLKTEPIEKRRQHLSKTEGKKNLPANFTLHSDLENKN